MQGGNDEDVLAFGDVCEGFEQVIAEMRIREMPKRAMWSIPMEIADGLTIGVKGFVLSSNFGLLNVHAQICADMDWLLSRKSPCTSTCLQVARQQKRLSAKRSTTTRFESLSCS